MCSSHELNKNPRIVDLFCGAGGFSLGAHMAGFEVAAAYDIDPILTSSFRKNFVSTNLLLKDISILRGDEVRKSAGGTVDGIIGGPPCQGFSDIGRRLTDDPRRELLGHFFRVVREVRPAFFIMENVPGLQYTDARGVLEIALKQVEEFYEIFGPNILDASDFGAATKRSRLFVIGMHKGRADPMQMRDIVEHKAVPSSVEAAISDLLHSVEIGEQDGFDWWRIEKKGRPTDYARLLRSVDREFTGHRKTSHSQKVINRFNEVPQGGKDIVGRHPRLAWNGLCPTLRAGTGADRGSYQSVRPIHPTEDRVITVREAARLQGFPDIHLFHPTIWHSFRMIGNSVSPIIAKAILQAVRSKFDTAEMQLVAAE
ncbi:MAG: DNA cytosine methyltransferase [Paracoccaceae bacterium]